MHVNFALAGLALGWVGATLAHTHSHARPHHHHHGDKREVATSVADVTVETVIVYELNGHFIPYAEVKEGIKNGTLEWVTESEPAMTSTQSVSSASSTPVPTSTAVPDSSPPDDQPTFNPKGVGLELDFPDDTLDCSSFPSDYGAIPVHWVGLQGWSGIQKPQIVTTEGMDDILTVVGSLCSNGNCCDEGSFCSYACPVGYQKAQWPQLQGRTGQSIGGLECKNGKLRLTNPNLSKTLCIPGTDAVTILVKNQMSDKAAVCRTDYPGTESETVPLISHPGTIANLTCPDAANYYKWNDLGTSAQYYVNPKGVSVESACVWSDGTNTVGNWAPLNLGVGYGNGIAYISMFQNWPTTDQPLDFTVEILGDNDGWDNLSDKCRYQDGQICTGEDYSNCTPISNEGGAGCTVSLSSGLATYVFS